MSRWRAGLVHSLVVVGRKHANGVSMVRRSTQKGATQDGGPESETSGFKASTPTKGSVMNVWLKPCGLE